VEEEERKTVEEEKKVGDKDISKKSWPLIPVNRRENKWKT